MISGIKSRTLHRKEILNWNSFKTNLLAYEYELFLYRAKNLHSYGCRMILYVRVGGKPSRMNPRKLEETWERFGVSKTVEL